jgi:hypothetical protein
MTTKQMEQKFQKMLHSDIKDKIFISIEDYQLETSQGIVVFLDEDFDVLYRSDPRMMHHISWYLENPKKNYTKALHSNNFLDNALAILDQQTGLRTINDWSEETNELLIIFFELRKKYQS